MIVKVMLFARVRELVGKDQIDLTLDDGCRVANLLGELQDRFPALGEILPRCMVSVNHEYADAKSELSDGCEVGLIPPVSGG